MTMKTVWEKLEEYESLKKENRKLKAELEVARKIINSYYQEDKHDINKYLENAKEQKSLSDNAKQFIQNIIKELDNESAK